MSNSIGEKCPECGADDWNITDGKEVYFKFCLKCNHYYQIKKQDFVSNFECPDCGSLSGKLEENDFKLGVRCSNCGKLFIKIEKKGVDNRYYNKPSQTTQSSVPRCPTCGSTNIEKISVGKKMKGGFFFGIFSSDVRNQFKCKNCGYKW